MLNKNSINSALLSQLNTSKIRSLVAGGFGLAAVYVLGTSTWLMLPLDVPVPAAVPAAKATPARGSQPTSVDIAALQRVNWFGQSDASNNTNAGTSSNQQLSAAESEAVESALKLDLIGVVLSDDTRFSRAIVNLQGKQQSFAIGEVLPAGRAVKLTRVLSDRIIIDNAGRFEYINLYENSDKMLAVATQSSPQTQTMANRDDNVDAEEEFVDLSDNDQVSSMVAEIRNKVMQDPNTLYQMVNISPVMEDGEMKGYRLSPASMKVEYKQLGFEDGDVLVAVNGMPLNSPQAISDVMASLQSGGIADLELMRKGSVINISVSLDAPQ